MATLPQVPAPSSSPDPGARPPGPNGPDGPARARRGRRLAAMLAASAVLGGATGAAVVAAIDSPSDSLRSATTVVEPGGSAGGTTAAAALDARTLYRAAAAGVVDLSVKTTSTSSGGTGPFGQPPSSQSTATGTGFVADAQGRIITAAHVVADAQSITVRFQDGTTRRAKLLGKDDATDVAVVQVDPTGLTLHPLKLGSSAALQVGDALAIIGDPFQFDRSISTGIVSGLDRTISAPNGFTVAHAIQTDAALNPGNSGGPVLAADGSVVGVVDQIATNGSAEQNSGVGFAVPIDLVSHELGSLVAGRTVSHPYLGISTGDASGTTTGALIGSVVSGGPAARAGVKAGDIVTAIGTTRVTGSSDLVGALAGHVPGDKVQLTLRRGGETLHLTVTLGTQPVSTGTTSG